MPVAVPIRDLEQQLVVGGGVQQKRSFRENE